MVVIPPRALANDNPSPIHVVQLGHSAAVAPAGRYLFYFTTPATGSTPSEDLRPAVETLLRIPSTGDPSTAATEQPSAADTADGESTGRDFTEEATTSSLPDLRPQVLVMGFYRQATTAEVSPGEGVPGNVALCPLPDGGVEYSRVIRSSEELYGSLFPGEPPMFAAPPSTSAAAAAAANGDDSDEEAIEALGEALQAAGIVAHEGT